MWFIFSMATALLWGGADLFYKKSSDGADSTSHLKITVAVGLIMGLHAAVYFAVVRPDFSPLDLIKYLPVSALYISSMMVGYIGLRYLEVSIASPVQNASGAVCALLCFIFFRQVLRLPEILGILLITAGLILLGILENQRDRRVNKVDSAYSRGFLAIMFPLIYCLLDGLGTFADAVYLDELELISEDAALIAYELTFFIVGVVVALYLIFVKKERGTIFRGKDRFIAAALETGGQFFYVYAMADRAIFAAPLIASYSIFSALFATLFLREKLSRRQYAAVAIVIAGIVALAFAE